MERDTLCQGRKAWKCTTLKEALEHHQERCEQFSTVSGEPVERLYTPLDVEGDYVRKLGFPGEYPFTRGVHPTMYRGRLWTVRMVAGFGTAEETNARFKYLLEQGQTGLSAAFDLPTLYGYDSDARQAQGEFGRCGVAASSLRDLEVLFEGIPLDSVSTSLIITSPAAVIWAMYIAAAEKQGVPMHRLSGTIQNDILKEYIAQNEYILPPVPSMRLVTDTVEFGSQHVPKWNTISVSGYHIREAGSTATQELAFTMANGMEYVRWGLERGLDVDAFAPRFSFFFDCHNDFLEEISKFRAARRIWAREMRHTFGAKDPRSWWLRFHTQTAGCSLTAQQPEVNIVRVAIQALAAVLGGTQSLHTNSLDEATALPSEHTATIAVRTQQIIAHESGVANTVDPLGGSYAIEALTDRMERQAYDYFERIEALGGVIPAIEACFFQQDIADAAYQYQLDVDEGRRSVVGLNEFATSEPLRLPATKIDPRGYERQLARLERVRAERDSGAVGQALDRLRIAAQGTENTMPYILDAVRVYATLQETMDIFREVYGVHREPIVV